MLSRSALIRLGSGRLPPCRVPGIGTRMASANHLARFSIPFSRSLITVGVSLEPGKFGLVMKGTPEELEPLDGEDRGKGEKFLKIPELWLRDNCKCDSCINKDTLQRSFDTFQISPDIRAEKALLDHKHKMRITWSDGHTSAYTMSWVQRAVLRMRDLKMTQSRQLWDAKALESAPRPKVSFHDFEDAAGPSKRIRGSMVSLMSHLHERGFCFIDQTPRNPESSKWMLEQIGPIRVTHYGGFYDFVPDLSSADTAYTNLALDPHTDTTYFTDPAGLQSFHMLSHTPPPDHKRGKGELGGKSILVDGFMVAEKMRELYPEDFETLRRVPIAWHTSGNLDASITPDKRYPVIETAGDGPSAEIRRIRWNNDDRGLVPLEDAEKWYEAARKWAAMVKSPEYQYLFQLEPGRMLVFDNWRLLHGRTAFQGLRRICGAYINRDDFRARWKLSRPFGYHGELLKYNHIQDYAKIAGQPISLDLEPTEDLKNYRERARERASEKANAALSKGIGEQEGSRGVEDPRPTDATESTITQELAQNLKGLRRFL